ncbi:MAG TPA: potassium channel protein [Candidatus Dormibacteraeota bacterium]
MVPSDNPLRAIAARFRRPALLLAAVIAYGIVGFALIERWNPFEAFYQTISTMSTEGGELHPLGLGGRIFSATLIVGGVATMLYAFGVFAEILSADEFGRYRRWRQLENRLSSLRDHYIVCGYGRIGTQIVSEFEPGDISYIVIEQTPEALGRLEREGRLHITGDAASEDILRRAGIERARCLISAVDADERAVYVVLAARALNPALYIVARAGQPESIRRLELAGADRVISPYRMAGHRMAQLATHPALVDVLDSLQSGTDVGVEELVISGQASLVGKTLDESGLLTADGARVLALRRVDGRLHVAPEGPVRIEEGDLIVVLGSADQLLATAAKVH